MAPCSLLFGPLALGLLVTPAFPQRNVAEQYLFLAANQERASRGIPLLHLDPSLTLAATQHARSMAASGNISHQFAGEPELSRRAAAAGAHFSRIAENVAEAPTPLILHDAWMRSPGHRENLLDPRVDAVGVAVIARGHQLYAVQDFARLTQILSLAEQETAIALLLDHAGLTLLPAIAQARDVCTDGVMRGAGSLPGAHPTYVLRYTTSNLTILPQKLLQHLTTGKFRYAAAGACHDSDSTPFAAYRIAVLLYP